MTVSSDVRADVISGEQFLFFGLVLGNPQERKVYVLVVDGDLHTIGEFYRRLVHLLQVTQEHADMVWLEEEVAGVQFFPRFFVELEAATLGVALTHDELLNIFHAEGHVLDSKPALEKDEHRPFNDQQHGVFSLLAARVGTKHSAVDREDRGGLSQRLQPFDRGVGGRPFFGGPGYHFLRELPVHVAYL